LSAAPKKGSNVKFTYSHWTCSRRLLPAPQEIVSIVWAFYRAHLKIAANIEGKQVFTEIPGMRDSNFLLRHN